MKKNIIWISWGQCISSFNTIQSTYVNNRFYSTHTLMFLASISANSEQSENSKHSTFYLQHFNFTSSLYRDVKLYKTIPLSVMNRGSIYRKNGIIFMINCIISSKYHVSLWRKTYFATKRNDGYDSNIQKKIQEEKYTQYFLTRRVPNEKTFQRMIECLQPW